MPFTATTSDIKLLKDSIDVVSQIIDEAVVKFKPEGLEILAADRAMVSVVDLKISSRAFDEYNSDGDNSVGLNLGNFLTILKRAAPTDKVTIKSVEGEKLNVMISGDSVRSFTIPVLNIGGGEVPNISQFEFPVTAELSVDVLSKGIEDANTIADSVVFEIGEKFRMAAETDMSKTYLELERGAPTLISLKASQEAKSRYPLEYLRKIVKASRISGQTTLRIGNDYPMKIEFNSENASLSVILAPRVSEE